MLNFVNFLFEFLTFDKLIHDIYLRNFKSIVLEIKFINYICRIDKGLYCIL
jgi:hypothetical protein